MPIDYTDRLGFAVALKAKFELGIQIVKKVSYPT